MADLAGFDVIFEVHTDTVIDAINSLPIPRPDGQGDFRLLGGPFSVALTIIVPQAGTATLNLILEFTLEPVVHQSILRLVATLRSGSCRLAGQNIDHIGGSLTLDVPLIFQLAPGQAAGAPWQIVLQTPAASVMCVFDAATQAKVGAVVQAAGVGNFANALIQAVRQLVGPVIPLPVPLFKVVPGIDSADPFQLSAVPIVAWIDAFTLGVFGSYSSGSGGSVSSKKEGDLYQANEEFFYGLSSTELVTPSRRTALLVSARAAHQVLFCPLIREGVVGPLRREQERQRLEEEIFSTQYWDRFNDHKARHFAEYFFKHLAEDDPTLAAWFGDEASKRRQKEEQARLKAEADIQSEVIAEIAAEADAQLRAWERDPASGLAIAAAVPPPCGTGTVQAYRQRIDVATVQSDYLTIILQYFDIVPDDGRLVVHYKADTFIEDILGDVKPTAEGDIEIRLGVTDSGAILADVKALPPIVSAEASGFSGTVIGILQGLAPSFWQALLIFMGLALQEMLQKLIDDGIARATSDGWPKTAVTTPVLAARAKEIDITKDSIVLIGLIARRPIYNTFSPALLLSVEKLLTASKLPPIPGSLELEETEWGCAKASFATKRVFWDTEIRVKARPRDLSMPLTMQKWTIDVGNFTVTSIGRFKVPDPRPRWSGAPALIQSGALRLSGIVNHPDPPLTNIEGGKFPLGHLTLNADIQATVAGSEDTGWSIRFRGNDGNFFVWITLDAIDGDKKPRHADHLEVIKGDELQMPREYATYKANCDEKYSAYSKLKRGVAPPVLERVPVAPGGEVTLLEQAARDVSRLVRERDSTAVTRLKAIQQTHGADALRALPLLASGSRGPRDG